MLLIKITSCTHCSVVRANSVRDAKATARAVVKHNDFGGGQASVAVAVPGGRWHLLGLIGGGPLSALSLYLADTAVSDFFKKD